jgi:beta-lactamase superfamily II metal-dependent hydrolase
MAPKIVFFPVDNGDMTLIELESGRTILIDVNIRESADDPKQEPPDVASMLRKRLKKDNRDRLYIDTFVLSHPDLDHCRGIAKHFHLGKPEDCPSDKILIRELWSSPMVFRRASKNWTLSDDAKDFRAEAKRRVQYFRDNRVSNDGNRILIMGEDENGKTDDLASILIKVDGQITKVNGSVDSSMTAYLLGPLTKSENIGEEDVLTKNRSSVILQFSIRSGNKADACLFLTGGDAEVAIWEKLWSKHKNTDRLKYHVLQTPHHCSWHSISYESWSKKGGEANISQNALNALSQAESGGIIVASCKPIQDNDSDPPCIGAKHYYEKITNHVVGIFKCTGEHPNTNTPDILEIEITSNGPRMSTCFAVPLGSSGAIGRQPLAHG